jgi:hypothetical protein
MVPSSNQQETTMKQLTRVIILCAALGASSAWSQDKPGAVTAAEVETVVTVRGVNQQERTVTVEGPEGDVVTFKVPDESQNLDQVYAGAKFKVRYLQAVAVGVVPEGGEPSAEAVETVEMAPKGATPGGIIARVTQITGKVEGIDQDTRTLSVRGPSGELRRFAVSEDIENLDQLQVGDTVGLRVTEAMAMEMLQQQ